jgi:hypothetical protein
VKFRAGALEFNASVVESAQAPSAQTGNSLASMTIQFRAQKEAVHEQAMNEAQRCQNGGLFSFGDLDEADAEWRVRDSTSSYVGTEPWGINHHVWRIEQVERLRCHRLRLGSLDLEPYDYAEELADDGGVRLAARALVTEAQLEAISRLAGAMDVVREGVSDSPRRMWLSGYVWGERPEGLVAVLACEDVREPRVRLAGFAASAADDLADLVALLPLDEDEVRKRRHARRRVTDPDGWPLS